MPEQTFIVPPCEAELEWVYEDDSIVVINKPSGLLSVPGRDPRNHDSVLSRLQETHADARVVHRLDMDTSGLMVLPLNARAHSSLGRQFQERRVSKVYGAWIYGSPEDDTGSIDLPLITDWPRRPRQMVCHETGKASLTRYEVLCRFAVYSEVDLFPHTGRSHQLRVHCAELGHPILGDVFYAHEQARALAPRLMLHARMLSFHHPLTGEPCEFQSDPAFSGLTVNPAVVDLP